MLGPAPLVDFDGTLVDLGVDWSQLRTRLGVLSIAELWDGPSDRWRVVTEAETGAARRGKPIAAVLEELRRTTCFAIITSNASSAAAAFLDRYPELAIRCVIVVGREQLGGPKNNWHRFKSAFDSCVSATASGRGSETVVYVGNAGYELRFAARLGARCYSVDDVMREGTPPRAAS